MLPDICSGLALAALTGALYALGMHFGPLNWNLGDDAFDLLVVVGIMLSATAFFVESLGSCLDRRLRQDMAKADDRTLLFEEAIRTQAFRLNAYAVAQRDSITAPDTAVREPKTAKVIPFPARRQQLRRSTTAYPQSSA
jgi:hypothetical protein